MGFLLLWNVHHLTTFVLVNKTISFCFLLCCYFAESFIIVNLLSVVFAGNRKACTEYVSRRQ